MEILNTILSSTAIAALISALVSTIATQINRRIDKKEAAKEKKDIQKQAICFILLRNLQSFAADLLKKDTISQEEFEQFEEMYQTYKALDGNGFADKWHAEINGKKLTF